MVFKAVLFLWLAAGVCLAADPVSSPNQPMDLFPPGMVGLFAGERCPEGWADEPLAAGRILLTAPIVEEAGSTVDEAFVAKEAPKHQHAYVATARLTGSPMPTRGDCCFTLPWILPQDIVWEGLTDERDSGLPFFAIRTCSQGELP